MDNAPIPREELDRALRKMCRRIAAALVSAMAETDTSLATIAGRIGQSETSVRAFLQALIDGKPPQNALNLISDFAFAMDCELEFKIVKLPDPPPEADTARREGEDG